MTITCGQCKFWHEAGQQCQKSVPVWMQKQPSPTISQDDEQAAYCLCFESRHPRSRSISLDECDRLNAHQKRQDCHPYTCGRDSTHDPLFATLDGWLCLQCDYHQPYSDELKIVELPPKTKAL